MLRLYLLLIAKHFLWLVTYSERLFTQSYVFYFGWDIYIWWTNTLLSVVLSLDSQVGVFRAHDWLTRMTLWCQASFYLILEPSYWFIAYVPLSCLLYLNFFLPSWGYRCWFGFVFVIYVSLELVRAYFISV